MDFSSSKIYAHPAAAIFDIMADFEGLASTFPQVSAYEETGQDEVRITINLDFGKFSGSYFADFHIHDLTRPHSIKIDGKHKSTIGGMKLYMLADIIPITGTENELTVSGKFERSGLVSWASKKIVKTGMDFALKYMHELVEEKLNRLAMFNSFSEEE
ncbi:MAG: carbon monoxide dehydrogenase subunit G [Saprospiraceae bacterium]|jgi:carbon monoxide dehydrogenase subunit G